MQHERDIIVTAIVTQINTVLLDYLNSMIPTLNALNLHTPLTPETQNSATPQLQTLNPATPQPLDTSSLAKRPPLHSTEPLGHNPADPPRPPISFLLQLPYTKTLTSAPARNAYAFYLTPSRYLSINRNFDLQTQVKTLISIMQILIPNNTLFSERIHITPAYHDLVNTEYSTMTHHTPDKHKAFLASILHACTQYLQYQQLNTRSTLQPPFKLAVNFLLRFATCPFFTPPTPDSLTIVLAYIDTLP